ncbi:MAG: T9SS type A sorting domain-containing protein [Candidatus Zixiibacteriota bacterium]|nr:MAG: T9SS type A sorting domain-containing protein [candidate division Zixibacteria bacterium]
MVISYNEIYCNSADGGGGIYCGSYDSSFIINNVIFDNTAFYDEPYHPGFGGAVYTYNGSTIFCNNTITGNNARRGGGLYAGEGSNPFFLNSILWDNTSQLGGEIEVYRADPILTYCNIQGGWPGMGNLDMNPFFRDPDSDDYHLMSVACGDPHNSPGIDTGHPDSLDGFLDCFWGLGGVRADMGAYGGGDSTMTDIESPIIIKADRFTVSQNYPNPFNSYTAIEYYLNQDATVGIEIYDILGRRVETLLAETIQPPGRHSIIWKADDYPSGIYLYIIRIGEGRTIGKCLLLK